MINPIIGRRELGKTTLARYLASARPKQLIVDPRSQWPVPKGIETYDRVEPQIAIDLDEGRTVIVQPIDLVECIEGLAIVMRSWLMQCQKDGEPPNLAIVLDEAGLYKDALRSWDWIFRCHPRAHMSILLTAHRPADISTTIRSISDRWCIFRTIQEHDLEAIDERCGKAVTDRVQTLAPYQFVSWDDAQSEATEFLNGALWQTPRETPIEGTPLTVARRSAQERLW